MTRAYTKAWNSSVGRSVMVTTPCRTGTDRVAEATRQLPCEVVVNLQADEILLSPDLLLDLIDPFSCR